MRRRAHNGDSLVPRGPRSTGTSMLSEFSSINEIAEEECKMEVSMPSGCLGSDGLIASIVVRVLRMRYRLWL